MSAYDDYCESCVIYGDDYVTNDKGELECRCSTCPFNNEENEGECDD